MIVFRDRVDAGEQLAQKVLHLRAENPVILALPRGGVPVGSQIANVFGKPLEVIVSRKLGAPGQPELGFGAVAEGGGRFVDEETVRLLSLSESRIDEIAAAAEKEIARRVEVYRQGRPLPEVGGRTVLLVDDGIATGGTVRAAIASLRRMEPARLIVAVPVAAAETLLALRYEVDEMICVEAPTSLWAIGAWYEDFSQLSDAEVLEWLGTGPEAGQEAQPPGEERPPA